MNKEDIGNFFGRIWYRIKTIYYNITIGMKNLIDWFPVIWKDRDWAYDFYTHKILLHKLKRLQKRPWEELIMDGDWMKRYLKLAIWCLEEWRRIEDGLDLPSDVTEPKHSFVELEEKDADGDALWSMKTEWAHPNDEKEYYDFLTWCDKRQVKVNSLLYHILEKRSGYWWD